MRIEEFIGTPANVSSTLEKVDGRLIIARNGLGLNLFIGTAFAGFGAGGAAGIIAAYPALAKRAAEILTPAGMQYFRDDILDF